MSSDRIYNFSAGPAVLPEPVLVATQKALWNFNGSGVGLMECSHRSPEFSAVIEQAKTTCRELASVPGEYEILFLQGGASSQFYMVPMNFLTKERSADYINTGAWSKKAIKEAKLFGGVHIAATSEDENYSYIPNQESIRGSDNPIYLHFTSNNTIAGTEWKTEPQAPSGVPLVCDASSDIFSRPIDISKYGILYAGAQKNLGPAGVTLVIIHKKLIETGANNLPTMLQYRTHANAGSLFNTPPALGIFVVGEVLKWIRDFGGLEAMAEYNREKAHLLYETLEQSKMFRPTVRPDSRSLMNVCFRASNEALEAQFLAEAKTKGLGGLKGHRSVGGMRASIYNAFPQAGVARLVEFIKEFERANA